MSTRDTKNAIPNGFFKHSGIPANNENKVAIVDNTAATWENVERMFLSNNATFFILITIIQPLPKRLRKNICDYIIKAFIRQIHALKRQLLCSTYLERLFYYPYQQPK